jgi:SAM-dependent methyltransferase
MSLRAWRNRWDYALRQALRLGRGGARLRSEPKDDLYADRPDVAARAAQLRRDYDLEDLWRRADRRNWCENLYYLELLERALAAAEIDLPARVEAADIGVSHWFYVQALAALLRRWRAPDGRQVQLTGYEIDAWRLHLDLRTRFAHAQAHLAGLPDATYVPAAFEPRPGAFDWVSLLFPFVFVDDHLGWGLPTRLFDPAALLAAAWDSLKPGGVLVIINQGEAEHAAQLKLLARAGIAPRAVISGESGLFDYQLPRFVVVALRS